MSQHKFRKTVDDVTKVLVDQGKLVEAGFVSYMHACFGPDWHKTVGASQIKETRQAFFGGSQHLFGSIISFLDAGEEPTDTDLRRMDQVDAELKKFISEFARDHMPTQGQA